MVKPNFFAGARSEYVLLTTRQLLSGKLRLRRSIFGGGAVFAVKKGQTGRLREVWHGGTVSALALPPPPPRRFPTPACFTHIAVKPGGHIWFSKRDAANYFDSLLAPEHLRPWFGRPPISVSELVQGLVMTHDEVAQFVDELGDTSLEDEDKLYPVSCTWPMGFSWSSCVAQDVSLKVCNLAGIDDDKILCDTAPPPSDRAELVCVCTDDALFFHSDHAKAGETLSRYEEAQDLCGVIRNDSKSITMQDEMTGLGCDFSNMPARVEASAAKVHSILRSTVDLLQHPLASRAAVHALLGLNQWVDLLARPILSVYDKVYAFVATEGNSRTQVPKAVQSELSVAACLLPLLSMELDREFAPYLVAADASTTYGFGVSVCHCSPEVAREIGSLSEKRGDYVRLSRTTDDEPQRSRLGKPHKLSLNKADFVDVVCAKARIAAHPGLLEANALLLAIKLTLRCKARQNSHVCFLVDAKTVLGAATKGRSSSPALLHVLRKIGAHILAGGICPHLVYIPSEDNPADAPSRGRRRRRKRAMKPKCKASRIERYLNRCMAALQVL